MIINTAWSKERNRGPSTIDNYRRKRKQCPVHDGSSNEREGGGEEKKKDRYAVQRGMTDDDRVVQRMIGKVAMLAQSVQIECPSVCESVRDRAREGEGNLSKASRGKDQIRRKKKQCPGKQARHDPKEKEKNTTTIASPFCFKLFC